MRVAGIAAGIVVALMGAVWTLQGLDSQYVPRSFMTASRAWIFIGVATLVGGITLVRWSWTRR